MNKYLTAIIFIVAILNGISKENEFYFYLKIKNPNSLLKYEKLKSKSLNKIKVTSSNKLIESLLNDSSLIDIEQPFLNAKTKSLNDLYFITCNNHLLIDAFSDKKEFVHVIEQKPVMLDVITPNDFTILIGDPLYLDLTGKYLDNIKARQAYKYHMDLVKVPVAVLDTKFELTHEDLTGKITMLSPNVNLGYGDDGHGTNTAGSIGGITNNNIGLSYVGYNIPVGASNQLFFHEVFRIAQLGYKIINCSWRNIYCNTFDSYEESIFNEIRDDWNTVVVCSAGNGSNTGCGTANDFVYPASYNSVLSVSSISHKNPIGFLYPTPNSNWPSANYNWNDCHEVFAGSSSSTHHHNSQVDIVAPGHGIPTPTQNIWGKYNQDASGTSHSAPLVSAAVSIVRSINPCLTATETIALIKNSADASIYNISYNQPYIGKLGAGKLDVEKACIEAIKTATFLYQNKNYNINTTETKYYIKIGSNINSYQTFGPVSVTNNSKLILNAREVEIVNDFEVQLGSELTINPSNSVVVCTL